MFTAGDSLHDAHSLPHHVAAALGLQPDHALHHADAAARAGEVGGAGCLTDSPSQQVALTLAECLTDIALAGKRLLNLAQKEMVKDALQRNPGVDPSEISVESNYRENMKRLRNAVKTLLMMAMSSSDEEMPAVGAGRGVDRRLRAR